MAKKKSKKFSLWFLVAAGLGVLAIVSMLLPFMVFEGNIPVLGKGKEEISGFVLAFQGEAKVTLESGLIGTHTDTISFETTIAMALVPFILVCVAILGNLASALAPKKFNVYCNLGAAAFYLVAAVLCFVFLKSGFVKQLELGESVAESWKLGVGAIFFGIFSILGAASSALSLTNK